MLLHTVCVCVCVREHVGDVLVCIYWYAYLTHAYVHFLCADEIVTICVLFMGIYICGYAGMHCRSMYMCDYRRMVSLKL